MYSEGPGEFEFVGLRRDFLNDLIRFKALIVELSVRPSGNNILSSELYLIAGPKSLS